MQRIVPNLWLNNTADATANFYTATFPDSKVLETSYYTATGKEIHGHNAGDILTVLFEINGYRMIALNGGPEFKPNPSVSFFYYGDTKEILDYIWKHLSDGGKVLIPLGEQPFSEYYGWVEDRYGVSWQLMLAPPLPLNQRVVPALLYSGNNAGKAEEAINLYVSVFDNSEKGLLTPYAEGMEPDVPGTVAYGEFMLFQNEKLVAMDSAREHDYAFSEGISLLVYADDQATLDRYWNALSAVPQAEVCGWLKDRYGVSWQIAPRSLDEMLTHGTPEQAERVMNAFLQMKKIDIAALQAAYEDK